MSDTTLRWGKPTQAFASALTMALALTVLAAVAPADADAAEPEDAQQLVFSRWTDGQSDLWSLDASDGSLTRLSRSRRFNEGMPAWSPDRTAIAYSRCAIAAPGRCELWLMDADGKNKRRLTFTEKAQESWPTWSPDGKEIAYTARHKQNQSIWVIPADGTDRRRITKKTFDSFPEWSPDGSRIAYSSRHAGSAENIWMISSDGDDAVQLTRGVKDAKHPDWAPDGESVVFSRDGDIWTIDVQVDKDDDDDDELPVARRLTRTPRWEFAPTYSVDGTRVAYNALMPNGSIAIWTMTPEGTERTRLTFAVRDFYPDW